MRKFVIAAAALAIAGSPAFAEYTVKGSVECPDIVREDSNENYRQMNMWWLLGYFSARNYVADQTVGKGIDNDNIYQMALGYCQSNPGNDWDDAAIHTYDLLD